MQEEHQQPRQHIELNYRQIDALEKEFQQILVELAGDQSLVRFKHEYDKLYRSLKRSHDNEKILYNKITELSRDMANQTAKLRLALKLSQQDAQAISFLKQQLEKTFKVLQLSKEREERAKQKIQAMNSKIKVLQSNLQQFQALSAGQSNAINDLKAKKQQLIIEKDELNATVTKIKNQLSNNYDKLRNIESEKSTIQLSIRNLDKDINQIDQKLRKDQGRKIKIQQQLDNLAKQKDSALSQAKKFQEEQEKLQAAISEKLNDIQESSYQQQEYKNQISLKQVKIKNLKTDFAHQMNIKSECQMLNSRLDDEIQQQKKQENNALSLTTQMQKHNDKLKNELVNATEAYQKIKRQNQILMNRAPQIQREIMDRIHLNKEDQQEIQQLEAKGNTIQKQLLKLETQFKLYNEKLAKKQKQIQANQEKINEGNTTIQNLKKQIQIIQKQKQEYGKKATASNAKYLQSVQEIKLKGNLISQYQKKNIQTQNKLKQQQILYQQVRSDRNTYSKNYSQTEDEIAQTKRRYKIVNHQINQLKQQIEAKQIALAKENFQHKKKDQTLLQHSRDLEKIKKQTQQKKEIIKNFHNEVEKLHHIIKDSQSKRQRKKDQYQLIVAERDILGTQLIRRNDQSALLYEKIKIQQNTLAKGQTAFRQRLADLKLLDYKKNDLKRQLRILMKQSSKIPLLKNQIYNIQSELIQQKLKVKALSEQLENPLNTTRCRNLQGTDPDLYEMNEKIKTLQKRLIFKTQEIVQKQVMVHQKQKQIQQIREIMKRQPGLQIAQKLSIMQRNLNLKTRKMKQLAAQINMYQAKTNENKYDIEKITKQIQQIKRKYNEQKKRQQIAKENQKILQM